MAQVSLEDAAPAPSIRRAPAPSDKISQKSSAKSSRTTSHNRRPSPPKSGLMNLTPNQLLINPTSPDVISGLLASFPTINASDPLGATSPIQNPSVRPSAKSSRQTSKEPSPRPSLSRLRPHLNANNRLAIEAQHREDDISELSSEDEAAMPPVVRTSRPPSGFNTPRSQSALRGARSRFAPSPQQVFSPPPERSRPSASLRRDTNGLQNGYQSPSQSSFSRHDSIDSARSRESPSKRFWKLYPRAKNRNIYSPSNASLRSAVNDYQRAGISSSSVQTPVQRSIIGSARLSEDDNESHRSNNAIDQKLQSSSAVDTTLSKGTQPPSSYKESKLLDTRNRAPVKPLSPSGSGYFPPAPPDTPSEVIETKQPTGIPKEDYRSRKVFIAPDDDEDETDVTRRIKELKAAREERRKSLKDRPFDLPSEDRPATSHAPKSPLQGNPPNTASAIEQLAEARMVDERVVSGDNNDEGDPYSLDVPDRTPEPSNVFIQKKSPVPAFSKERTFIVESRDSTTRSTARPSLETSVQSQLVSKTQGGLSPQIPPPGSPKSEHRRNRFSFSRSSPMVEDHRPSFDPVGTSVQDFLASQRLSQQVFFPSDGRRISFSEVGDPNGYVVFCCVGMGLTRYIMAYYDELATSLKLRLITPDRPGIGDSEPYVDGEESPYEWPDDVQVICAKLGITRFSVLAHSAGVIYALATALRMSQFLRGKMHLLAPWIPPSQLTNPNASDDVASTPSGSLPRSQRFLRMLPTSFLKLSNSPLTGLSRNNSPKGNPARGRKGSESAVRTPRQDTGPQGLAPPSRLAPKAVTRPPSPHLEDIIQIPSGQDFAASVLPRDNLGTASAEQQRRLYDRALTPAIWEKATRNANPAVDLLICLERRRPIGFRYADVGSKPVRNVYDAAAPVDDVGCQWPGYGIVIHHGSKDTRVPVENAKWLGRVMTKAEVRVLEGEGHGLMAAAGVMGSVLSEIGKEWANASW